MSSGSDLPDIYFATSNPHKSSEVGNLLYGLFHVLNLKDLNQVKEIPETGETIEENSLIKARYIYNKYGVDCFADDTGLEVKTLNGEPGVFSARYAGEPKDDQRNIDLLIENLQDAPTRKARFRTVITLILEGKEIQFEGTVYGSIIEKRRGSNGFGYDPVFVPDGFNQTFAEMNAEEKNLISHRGQAVRKLVTFLTDTVSDK